MALNELKDSTGNTATGTKLYSFKIGGQNIVPQFNAYSVEGKNIETYTYMLSNMNKPTLNQRRYYGIEIT